MDSKLKQKIEVTQIDFWLADKLWVGGQVNIFYVQQVSRFLRRKTRT